MSIEALTTEPASLYAGDTINWLIAVPDYPASAGWTLKYNAVSAAGRFTLTGAESGDSHAVSAAKATTAVYLPGEYTLTKYVESTTERLILGELPLKVLPDLAAKTAAFDNRSHVKKVLDSIEAVLEGNASSDQQEITIDGTTLKRKSAADLLKLHSRYSYLYKQELAATGQSSNGRKILVRF